MWHKYDAKNSFPENGIVMFEIQHMTLPQVKTVTPVLFHANYRGEGNHLIDPLLDGPGGLDYTKFKPTHFFVIPKREND